MTTSFEELTQQFEKEFSSKHFPEQPENLYNAAEHILSIAGKRIRPVMLLMSNELFSDLNSDSFDVAKALELFHNFTLVHDDIMDKAPLRRGKPTVHTEYGEATAILAGDVMLIKAYSYLSGINSEHKARIIHLFNKTATEVCEGQQMDMDFEHREEVGFEEYEQMISLKTSVLLGAAMRMGGILGGASQGNLDHLFEFGKSLGMAFQVQDDYLDSFGDPQKFGKQVGGDIKTNKKTFLLIHAFSVANEQQKNELKNLLVNDAADKVDKVIELYNTCGVPQWAAQLKEKYVAKANYHLDEAFVTNARKEPLRQLTHYLLNRDK